MANIDNNKYDNIYSTRNIAGKEYSVVDINNLKEANKRMDEFIKKQQKIIENGKQLSKAGQESLHVAQSQLVENEKIIKTWNRFITDTTKQNKDNAELLQKIMKDASSNNNQPMPKNVAEIIRTAWTNKQSVAQQKEIAAIYEGVADKVTAKYKRSGADFTNPDVIDSMNKEIASKTTAEFSQSVKKFGKKSELMNVAIDTFKKAVDTWVGIFKAGLNKQVDTYESTFTGLSVRNGISRQNYYDAQWRLNNRLSDMGLRDNIGSSEVQMAWSKMAENGVKIDLHDEQARAETTAKAIENVLTNSIVPYLDTNSAQWDQLITAQPELQKNIRGINRLNTELVGNNYATQELVQSILDDLQPISDSALNDLAMSASGATSFINSMMASGMDKATAESLWKEYYKQQSYGAEILRSGSLSERMSLTNAMDNGINIYSSADTGYALGNIASTRAMISGWGTGYGNTVYGVTQSALNSAAGIDPRFAMWQYSHQGSTNSIINNAIATSNRAMQEIDKYGNLAAQEFADGKNQTNKKMQDIYVENMANEFAFFNEWLGNWANVIKVAIEGIGALIMGKLIMGGIGKGISALSGVSGSGVSAVTSSGGLFASLGAAGPIALGVAGVAATLGVAALAATTIARKMRGSIDEYDSGVNNRYNDYITGEGGAPKLNEFDALARAADESQQKAKSNSGKIPVIDSWIDENTGVYTARRFNWQTNPLEYYDFMPESVRTKLFGDQVSALKWGHDEAKDALNSYLAKGDATKYNAIKSDLLKVYLQSSGGKANYEMSDVLAAIMVAANYQGLGDSKYIEQVIQDLGGSSAKLYSSKDDITKYLNSAGITEAMQLSKIYAMLNATDSYFMVNSSNFLGYPNSTEQLQHMRDDFNLHRLGLNYVPYDNYPALLHEGETILTAATANELRNLLDEYRQTSQQAVNFDTIIQQQTSDLINKMNEIISVISNGQDSSFTNTLRQINARNKLTDSMRYMESTKAY